MQLGPLPIIPAFQIENLAGLVYIVWTDPVQIPVEPMHDPVQIAVVVIEGTVPAGSDASVLVKCIGFVNAC